MNLVRRVENLELLRRRLVPPESVPLNCPADVLALLTEQANAARADVGVDPTERARTLVGLSAVALRAMEQRDLAARLDAVERVLKLRRKQEKDDSHGNKRR